MTLQYIVIWAYGMSFRRLLYDFYPNKNSDFSFYLIVEKNLAPVPPIFIDFS